MFKDEAEAFCSIRGKPHLKAVVAGKISPAPLIWVQP